MSSTITSASAVLTLVIPDVYPVPQQIQGFAVDDAFTTEAVDVAEVQIGVDGLMSAGFTPFITPLTIMLQADSPSILIMDGWSLAQQVAREVLYANATIAMPSINRVYVFTKGVLSNLHPMPPAKKVLNPQQYMVKWQSIVAMPI